MKRFFALALCLAMLLTLALPASAAKTTHDVSLPFDLDITDVTEESGYFQPGKVYYIPLKNENGGQIEKGEFAEWKLSVKVEQQNTDKTNSRGGASVSLVYLDDGMRYLRFSSTSSAATKEDAVYLVTLTGRDTWRSKGDDIYEGTMDVLIDVGYGQRGFINSATYVVDEKEPIADVSDDINEVLVTFPDGSRFNMVLSPNSNKNKDDGIYRVVNLSTSNTPTTAISNALAGYDYDYIGFSAATTFREGSQLRIYAPGRTHLYEANSTGGLTKLNFTRAGDFMVINTTRLSNYVMASGDLPTSGASTTTTTGSGSTTGTGTTTTTTGSALSAATAGTSADSAVAAGNTTVRFSGVASVPLDAIQAVASRRSITTAYFDTLTSTGGVETRLYVKPGQATKAFNASTSLSSTGVASVKATFNKFYSNKVAVLQLGHVDEFGMTVEVATKLSLSGMDTSKLVFYSYNATTNSYSQITSPGYWIDGSGYLHFNTTLGNYIVVSEGTLTK